MSSAPFDPYQQWLGIEPYEQPADHYRMLGLARFETDLQKISRVADERMAMVRSFQMGPRGAYTQKLLNELAAARVCLLNPDTKHYYDQQLAQRLAEMEAHRRAAAMPSLPSPREDSLTPPAPLNQVAASQPAAHSASRRQSHWQALVLAAAALLAIVLAGGGWAMSGWLARRPQHGANQTAVPPKITKAPAPKPSAKSQSATIEQQADGSLLFPPSATVLGGELTIDSAGSDPAISQWSSTDDEARWRFRVTRPGFFAAELTYTVAPAADEVQLELRIDERTKTCSLRPSASPGEFLTDTYMVAVPQSGTHQLTIRPRRLSHGDDLRLKSVRLIPMATDARPAAAEEK